MFDAAQVTLEARAEAESVMETVCKVERQTGETERDFKSVPVYETVYGPGVEPHGGRCWVTGDRPYEQSPEAGGATFIVQRHIWKTPTSAGPFKSGDLVTVIDSQMQPHLIGNVYRVAGPDERTYQSSQRMFVDIIAGNKAVIDGG